MVNIEEPMSSERVFRLDETLRTDLNGDGVHWTLEGDSDLNVNLVHLDPGSGVGPMPIAKSTSW